MSDAIGLALAHALRERAETLPVAARARLLARAELLREDYQRRVPRVVTPRNTGEARSAAADAWRQAIAARVHERVRREPAASATPSFIAELRASTATARAASQVPLSAGPYNGAAVASRALGELVAIAPTYVSHYVAWLEDLATLADFPERRVAPRKT